MMNGIWIALVCASVMVAAYLGNMLAVTEATVEWAGKAVSIAIGLIGVMAFWLGMVRVLRDAGLLRLLARALRPIMVRLFPGVPAEHPAMASMIMNMGANMMGLVNAATPFGIKAMEDLDRLNPQKGTATNAMCLFLAINTSNVALFPLGVASLRATVGSEDPFGIWLPTLVGTSISTVVAIIAAKSLSRMPRFRATDPGSLAGSGLEGDEARLIAEADPESAEAQKGAEEVRESRSPARKILVRLTVYLIWALILAGGTYNLLRWFGVIEGGPAAAAESPGAALAAAGEANRALAERGLLELVGDVAKAWLLPLLIVLIALWGWLRGVKVYESLVTGAREGFDVALRIIPYLVAILVAVGMFQASGALDILIGWLTPLTSLIGLPAEALPVALLRPLSGSGSYGVLAHVMETNGPDSYVGYLTATMQGSTETTFYVLAVYFGAVAVRRVRHALAACLIADLAGVIGAVIAVNLFLF
jgi:spore maturation protein SpmA